MIAKISATENLGGALGYNFKKVEKGEVEKPLYFDPFGQIEFAHFGHNIITPCKVLV